MPTIITLGGGGFSMEPENPRLDEYILRHARSETPNVCFVPTASGDSNEYVVNFYTAFSARPDVCATHLPLFRRGLAGDALRETILEQDVVYVGGGSTANLLAIWRAHGLDSILREAYAAGIVLCGVSAGSICWHESGLTDSFGDLAPLHGALGLLAGSHCPHYRQEPGRRERYLELVARGELSEGTGVDDSVALRYEDGVFVEAVASTDGVGAVRVTRDGNSAVEHPLDVRRLP